MYKNKKGISTVITMLILVALVLIAIGAVWYVVQNVLDKGTEQVTEASLEMLGDCEDDFSGTEMINQTHINSLTPCNTGDIRLVHSKYCCI